LSDGDHVAVSRKEISVVTEEILQLVMLQDGIIL
jgi:hypothetical protein